MAVCLCIVSSGSSNREKIFFRGVLLLICIELFLNAEHLYFHSSQFESSTVDEYTSYVERVTPLVEYVKDTDGLFRTVLTGEARRMIHFCLICMGWIHILLRRKRIPI